MNMHVQFMGVYDRELRVEDSHGQAVSMLVSVFGKLNRLHL